MTRPRCRVFLEWPVCHHITGLAGLQPSLFMPAFMVRVRFWPGGAVSCWLRVFHWGQLVECWLRVGMARNRALLVGAMREEMNRHGPDVGMMHPRPSPDDWPVARILAHARASRKRAKTD